MRIGASLTLCIFQLFVWAGDSPQFRGPQRDGHFQETNLLKSWPEEGPEMIWSYRGLGQGYASVAVVDNSVYTTGMSNFQGHLFAFDPKGKLLWRKGYGEEHHGGGSTGIGGSLNYICILILMQV